MANSMFDAELVRALHEGVFKNNPSGGAALRNRLTPLGVEFYDTLELVLKQISYLAESNLVSSYQRGNKPSSE